MSSSGIQGGDSDIVRKKILLLFDVDGTLTPARKDIEERVDEKLQSLRKQIFIGLVGGSDLRKIAEQTLPPKLKSLENDPIEVCIQRYDYVFAENGLVANKNGQFLEKQSILNYIGEEKLQTFINFCLGYMSTLKLPAKRGNFIEFRNGLINVCPVGRSCSQAERDNFAAYDKEHNVRRKFIDELEKRFGQASDNPLGLVYIIGGQISFDVFPKGWDKTYCLRYVDSEFEQIHFFGDKTSPGGNDYEIFIDERTIGHSVTCPDDTLKILDSLDL